jgi:membrane protease YdiL (CAAX protease family)
MLDPAPGQEQAPPLAGPAASSGARRSVPVAERLAAAAEVLLCSGLPTQLLLIGLLATAGMPSRGSDGSLSPPFIILLSLLDTLLVVGLVLLFLRGRGESAKQVLLGTRPVFREALVGVAIMPVVFVGVLMLLVLIVSIAPGLHNVARNPLEDLLQTRGDTAAFTFVVMVAGGVREEVQRGFILHRFEQFLGGATTGVVVFSVFFGLGHVEQGWDAAIATGVLGACWGVLYLLRRSIIAPMVSHAGFNLAQLAKYFVVAG